MTMDTIKRLTYALRTLPGVGPKSAQRMAYYLLQHRRDKGFELAKCLEEAMRCVQHCQRCNNFTEHTLCRLCSKSERDFAMLCVVESPGDIDAIEQSQVYHGGYFVLMGKISPLDGLGPEEIGLHQLKSLIMQENTQEVILAISPGIEGQTTVHFIHQLLEDLPVHISQPAHGIPSGGELEYLDSNTIGSALQNRSKVVI